MVMVTMVMVKLKRGVRVVTIVSSRYMQVVGKMGEWEIK